jgi:hypothetical protein
LENVENEENVDKLDFLKASIQNIDEFEKNWKESISIRKATFSKETTLNEFLETYLALKDSIIYNIVRIIF